MNYEDEVFKFIQDDYEKTGIITESFSDRNLDTSTIGKDVLIRFEIGNSENLSREKAILAATAYLRTKMKQPLAVIEFVAFGKDQNKDQWHECIETIMGILSPDDILYISPLVDVKHRHLHHLAFVKNARLIKGLYEK